MSADSIFSKIYAGEIPAEIVAESENVFAIADINPQAPVHFLVIPKSPKYSEVADLAAEAPEVLQELVLMAKELAETHANGQYRLVFNSGREAGQTVFHVHGHVLAGELEESSL